MKQLLREIVCWAFGHREFKFGLHADGRGSYRFGATCLRCGRDLSGEWF